MNSIFQDLLDKGVMVYLDDILIYSNNISKHRKLVQEVLRQLWTNGLCAKLFKCFWHTDTVEYLRYILFPDGLRMDEAKVKVIQDWPVPRKVKDVQSFLGFANFYRRFILFYSDVVIPLTQLTRKGTAWAWTDKCQKSFESLKEAFTRAPVLTQFTLGSPLMVETDASD
ncbi:hypothetical protein NM688_g5760 [Phlebia brevispora]|uniref:Uncharacterized protein n=1 Tax=Phlebia brevispora TaxID=194682 RepID=A0ACC1SQ97_9APHY|nr:hypothetical protein NM688_g5760 [Phlebia brevispora]